MEEVVIRLASGQRARGHDVTTALILAPGDSRPPLEGPLDDAGVRVVSLRIPARAYGREIREVRSVLGRLGVEVLHTHGYRPDVLHPRAAAPLGIPRVTTLHGFTGGDWRNRFYEALQVRSARSADGVVAVSRAMRDRLLGQSVPADRIHLIPNAWSSRVAIESRDRARQELKVSAESFLVGWVGRLSREKGPDILLDALADMRDPGVEVAFVGDGPLRKEVEDGAKLNRGIKIRCHGMIPDAGRLFSAFDLFVLSSRTEGTPIALFEAMEASIPIVASAVGGVPDVVSTDEAMLVPPEDPKALGSAIRLVRSDAAAAAERARRARLRLLRDFAVSPWLDRYDALYSSVLNDHPSPR